MIKLKSIIGEGVIKAGDVFLLYDDGLAQLQYDIVVPQFGIDKTLMGWKSVVTGLAKAAYDTQFIAKLPNRWKSMKSILK